MFYPPVKFGGDMSSDFCVIMLTHTHTHIPVYRAADRYTHATPATLVNNPFCNYPDRHNT